MRLELLQNKLFRRRNHVERKSPEEDNPDGTTSVNLGTVSRVYWAGQMLYKHNYDVSCGQTRLFPASVDISARYCVTVTSPVSLWLGLFTQIHPIYPPLSFSRLCVTDVSSFLKDKNKKSESWTCTDFLLVAWPIYITEFLTICTCFIAVNKKLCTAEK